MFVCRGGVARTEAVQRTMLRSQLTCFQNMQLWTAPKGYTKKTDSLADMKEAVKVCILKISSVNERSSPPVSLPNEQSSPPVSLLSSSTSEPFAPIPSDESEVNTDNEDIYDMPCCSVTWDQDGGYDIVQCNKCHHWLHIGPLGTCAGESCSTQQARSVCYYHISSLCGRF